MKFHRIQALLLRYLFQFRRSYDSLTDAFYWPALDLLLWGLTSKFLQDTSHSEFNILLTVLSGIIFWIIFWRAQYEITMGFLYELWNKNLINMFVSPLKFSEWVTAWLLMGIMKGTVSFLFACAIAFALYKTNIFSYGLYMIPFAVVLAVSAWWIGFIIAGFLMRYGVRIQTVAWSIPWLFAPFSAIYYPVSSLPQWAQYISKMLPMSYVFEGLRQVMKTGSLDWNLIIIAMALNLIYLPISIIFLKKSFSRVLNTGVTKLY